jgi:histidyl-tRNA synthetase
MSAGALPGFRDFYPEQFAERAWLFEVWRRVARRFGFVEYDGPPLESLELYTKKSGDEIVGQLYNFKDKGDRDVALRPEMTPTVARMVAAKANALRKPVKWFSIPQLFRYERQQKGRLREHFQLNVDIFGEADVSADAELLAVACEIMRECGLGPDDVRARVSDRRLLTALLRALEIPASSDAAVFAAIDKIERIPRGHPLWESAWTGIPATTVDRLLGLVESSDLDAMAREFAHVPDVAGVVDRMLRYRSLVEAHGVGEYLKLDLKIVRGLAYYTGIVFELFDAKGQMRAICGGGRYDNLLEALGGVDMPALGFGMGDVVLSDLLRERGKAPATPARLACWVAPKDDRAYVRAVNVAAELRRRGLATDYPLRTQSLSKQVKVAADAGAGRVVFVGDIGDVEVKTLADGSQTTMSLERLYDSLENDGNSDSTGATDHP